MSSEMVQKTVSESAEQSIKKVGFGTAMKIAEPIFEGAMLLWDYNDRRKNGESRASALAKAGASAAFYLAVPAPISIPAGIAMGMASAAPDIMAAAHETGKISTAAHFGSFGGNFQVSERAATMRQAGVDAIQNNGLNLRSVLGSEARQYGRF